MHRYIFVVASNQIFQESVQRCQDGIFGAQRVGHGGKEYEEDRESGGGKRELVEAPVAGRRSRDDRLGGCHASLDGKSEVREEVR